MEDEDNEVICRFCFVGDKEKALIRVCKCKGSLEFVHQDCIDEWVFTSKKLLCMCGYRMTLQRQGQKLTMWEKFEEVEKEVLNEQSERALEKELLLVYIFVCYGLILVVTLMLDLLLNGMNLAQWLVLSSTGNQVLWVTCFLFLLFPFCWVFYYMKLYVPKLLRKMRQDRYKYKWAVKEIK